MGPFHRAQSRVGDGAQGHQQKPMALLRDSHCACSNSVQGLPFCGSPRLIAFELGCSSLNLDTNGTLIEPISTNQEKIGMRMGRMGFFESCVALGVLSLSLGISAPGQAEESETFEFGKKFDRLLNLNHPYNVKFPLRIQKTNRPSVGRPSEPQGPPSDFIV